MLSQTSIPNTAKLLRETKILLIYYMMEYNIRVEVLNLCFDFESRASAVLRLKFRGPEAISSRAQSQNIADFGRESRNIDLKIEM